MSSYVNLKVGGFEVDWGQNNIFSDHSDLFQPNDLKKVPYNYVNARGRGIRRLRPALKRPLSLALPRLELLGYTIDSARVDYERLIESGHYSDEVSFSEFAAACAKVDCSSARLRNDGDYDFGEFAGHEVVPKLFGRKYRHNLAAARRIGELFENLTPANTLILLAQNPTNLSCDLTWYFADVVESGYASLSNFHPELPILKRFLVVTEGSSDSKVIQRALHIRRPEIEDFFYFVDMAEYPFTGIGNLYRFTQGLARIQLANGCVVLYDNDAEGLLKYRDSQAIRQLPSNLRIMKLPDLPEFEKFWTMGPTGPLEANINGRAASIECYLDLRSFPAIVQWTNYVEKSQEFQGSLQSKEKVVKDFFRRCTDVDYDFAKLDAILAELVENCKAIARRSYRP